MASSTVLYRFFKRLVDLALSLLLLCLLTPLMLPIMLGLRLTGEGYIFYRQDRVGFRNKPFKIIKFATMLLNSPNMEGGILTRRKDPRITPLGGPLRRFKINELPQLLNILKGDMSFIGPRPVMPKSFAQYPEAVQNIIYNVRPGITGLGSVVFNDEEELINQARDRGDDPWQLYTQHIYPYKGELELWYQQHESFLLDAAIVLCTAISLVWPDNGLIYRLYPDIPRQPKLQPVPGANS